MSAKNKQPNKVVRSDSYDQTFKSEQTAGSSILTMYDLTQFYIDDPLARKIVDVIPEEMVTPGFGLDGIADEKAFKSTWDSLHLNEKIIEALCWSRLYGGSAIVAVVRDNRALTSPISDAGGVLESIRVYEKDQVKVKSKEQNARNPRFGLPKIYTINPGDGVSEYDIHYSRLYVFDGSRIPDSIRRQNNGWGVTILSKKLVESIQDYNYCEELATQLLRRKQQGVWKARGLADLCDDDEGRFAARIRLAQVDDNSGVGRSIGIDATDEEYEVLNSDISGVDTFLDKKMDRIVNYSGIHEIILKNKNVGGVSSSQNTALETFYKLIDRRRNEIYRPFLEWIIPFIIADKEWNIRFEPLSVPSEKDQAETFGKYASAIKDLVTEQVVDPDEARDTLEAVSDVLKLKAGSPKLPPRDPKANEQGNDPASITPEGKNNEGETDS